MRARTLVVPLVVLLLLAAAGSGFLLPRYVELSVASQLSASPDVLFPVLETPSEWASWAPWTGGEGIRATVASSNSGPASGVGAQWTWRIEEAERSGGDDVAVIPSHSGTLRITQAVPSVVLDYEVTINDARPSYGAIRLAPNAGGTMVYWSMTADMGGSPIARWRGVRWPSNTRPAIEAALARLDQYAASKPAASPILGREIPGLLEFVPRPE